MTEQHSGSTVALKDEQATAALGAALAKALPATAVLYLHGDLGAGKTTLARGLLRALGVAGTVRSPTYTLVERYPTAAGSVLHLDLYRIAEPGELDFLGLDSELGECRLCIVEWPERGGGHLPRPDLLLRLAISGSGREATVEACSERGHAWAAMLAPLAAPGRGRPDSGQDGGSS